jgi:hypothetical protein
MLIRNNIADTDGLVFQAEIKNWIRTNILFTLILISLGSILPVTVGIIQTLSDKFVYSIIDKDLAPSKYELVFNSWLELSSLVDDIFFFVIFPIILVIIFSLVAFIASNTIKISERTKKVYVIISILLLPVLFHILVLPHIQISAPLIKSDSIFSDSNDGPALVKLCTDEHWRMIVTIGVYACCFLSPLWVTLIIAPIGIIKFGAISYIRAMIPRMNIKFFVDEA